MQTRSIVHFLLAAGLLHSASAGAAEKVYKCRGPSGAAIFSDTPCGKDAEEVEMAVQPSPSAPPPQAVPAPAVAVDEGKPGAADPSPAIQAAVSSDYPAYKCFTPDGMVFYRHAHCPKNVAVTRLMYVGGLPTETPVYAPVEEIGISTKAACAAIYPIVDDHRFGNEYDERYTTMERNQGKDPCK